MSEEHWPEAYAAYTLALAVDPANSKVRGSLLLSRADASGNMERPVDVIADCTEAIQLDVGNLKALTKRAKAYEACEEWAKALMDLEAAAEVNPDLVPEVVELRFRMQQRRGTGTGTPPEFGAGGRRGSFGGGGGGNGYTYTGAGNNASDRLPVLTTTLYDVLGVQRDADPSQIRAQYRKLTLQFHPDKVVNAAPDVRAQCENRFKEISHAYGVLSDGSSRLSYDASLPR